jgi:hypothetical protein
MRAIFVFVKVAHIAFDQNVKSIVENSTLFDIGELDNQNFTISFRVIDIDNDCFIINWSFSIVRG